MFDKGDLVNYNKYVKTEIYLNIMPLLNDKTKSYSNTYIYSLFQNILSKAKDLYIPSKFLKVDLSVPWITYDLEKRSRQKQRVFNRMKKFKIPANRVKYRVLQKLFKTKLRNARNNYLYNELEPSLDINSKKLFSLLKRLGREQTGINCLLNKHSNLITTPEGKSEILSEQFQSVMHKIENKCNIKNILPSPYKDINITIVTRKGICMLLKELDTSKATGPDKVSNREMVELNNSISDFLVLFFQNILDTDECPHQWKHAL